MSINVISTQNLGTPSGQISAIKDLQREMASVRASRGYIGPQAIGSSHIGQSQITAGHIEAGSIGATHIAANAIQTVHLDAQVVTAAKLAATLTISSVIQTAATGARVVLSNAGLYAYDSLNAEKLGFDIDTGSMRIAGALTAGSGSALPITYLTSGSLVTGTVFRLDSGGYFETSAANPRVVIDSAGWRSYDASGVLTTEITNSTATFQGATFRTGPVSGARIQLDGAGLHSFASNGTSKDMTLTPTAGLDFTVATSVDDPRKKLRWLTSGGTPHGEVFTVLTGGAAYLYGRALHDTNAHFESFAGRADGTGRSAFIHGNAQTSTANLKLFAKNGAVSESYIGMEDDGTIYLKSKLGINTLGPTYALDVTGDIRWTGIQRLTSTSYWIGASNGYRFNNAADTANLLILSDVGLATVRALQSEVLRLVSTSNTPHMTFYNNGATTRYAYIQALSTDLYLSSVGSIRFQANNANRAAVTDTAMYFQPGFSGAYAQLDVNGFLSDSTASAWMRTGAWNGSLLPGASGTYPAIRSGPSGITYVYFAANEEYSGWHSKAGGFTALSSERFKHNFREPESVLAKVRGMPVYRWDWNKADGNHEGIGPTAEDFQAWFPGLMPRDVPRASEFLSPHMLASVALVGVKELAPLVDEVESLERTLDTLIDEVIPEIHAALRRLDQRS